MRKKQNRISKKDSSQTKAIRIFKLSLQSVRSEEWFKFLKTDFTAAFGLSASAGKYKTKTFIMRKSCNAGEKTL